MEIKVVHQILEWNEDVSDKVKQTLSDKKVCLVNVMGSPGAGKTSVITSIINKLSNKFRIGVIEGDIAGQIDAEKM
ncbi:MAG: hydrogenase accessory protein HypB, partial [Clostridia bacterium]|nr:hydrogenase accessory protein HypB [Clostridia bacterium]